MKNICLLLLSAIFSLPLAAQLNMTLRAEVNFPQRLNDIWGYEADGREYALVGSATGVAIFDITDPDNPEDKGFLSGPESIWRDIKVWDSYAYVTNETGGGINVINLTNLPDQITEADAFRWEPNLTEIGGQLGPCHNIFIDVNGIGHLSGCNLNAGGVFFIDLATDPANPAYVAAAPAIYSHDAYVRDNKLYSSEIFEGQLGIYDISDLNNVQLLATQETPFDFTHNAWLSDDSNVVFTTDEVGNAPVGVYDISDLDDIRELDQFRPLSTINQGVLPHNVFVWNDFLIISYYTDGCILADASRPDNIIEVGNFDTLLPGESGSGAWGVYPYFTSGTVVVSDINQGFFVLTPNYVRACHLEGKITNAVTGAPISDARVVIGSAQVNFANSTLAGDYQTGQVLSGNFTVTYSHPAYETAIAEVTLENGELFIQDIQLNPLPTTQFTAQVIDAETGLPIANTAVSLVGQSLSYEANTDGNGNFSRLVVDGIYDVSFATWGYFEKIITLQTGTSGPTVVELTPGFKDDFIFDLGWQVVSSASDGFWERGEPAGTDHYGQPVNTDVDISGDLGDQCYVTGNGGGSIGADDVDNGFTRLISPSMNLSSYTNPELSFHYWFFNAFGNNSPNDTLEVKVDNGLTEVTIVKFAGNEDGWSPRLRYNLADFIMITDEVKIIFETSDLEGSSNVVEAAVDRFLVRDAATPQLFTTSATSGCDPFEITYTDVNETATSRLWTFEGGEPATSNLQNPTVTYTDAGNYKATLNLEMPNGTFELSQDLNVTTFTAPSAEIGQILLSNGQVIFTSNATDGLNYLWTFGDGRTSTQPNPTHLYDADGTYPVILSVSNPCGSTTVTSVVDILVTNTTDLTENLTELKVFPNPSTTQFEVTVDYQATYQKGRLLVYDLMGKMTEAVNFENGGLTSLGQDLSPGMYVILVEIDGVTIAWEKVVKL